MSQTKEEAGHSILVAVDDMFFASKIRGTAESLGVPVTMVRSQPGMEQAFASATPALVILDLNSQRMNPIEIIRLIKSLENGDAVTVIGFLSHVQVDLKQRAEEAGCDRVMPRSLFTQRLADIISGRY